MRSASSRNPWEACKTEQSHEWRPTRRARRPAY
jgi:hypothetical protein